MNTNNNNERTWKRNYQLTDAQISVRADQIERMHDAMEVANDEKLYDEWLLLVDGLATRECFEKMAADDSQYYEAVDTFAYLVNKRGYRW